MAELKKNDKTNDWLYRVRDELSAKNSKLSQEERVRQANERAAKYAKEFGVKLVDLS